MEPSTNVSNGHDTNGRFTTGNQFGHGNPHSGQVAKFRSALLSAVTEADLVEIVQALVTSAKGGDLGSAKLIIDRICGKVAVDAITPPPPPLSVEQRRQRLRQITERILTARNADAGPDDAPDAAANFESRKAAILAKYAHLRIGSEAVQ